MNWLPSDERWVQEVADRLFDGEVLLLRGLPRSGKSSACEAIAELLGESAVVVKGAEFSESSQAQLRRALDSDVDAKVAAHGCAQVLFDDYGRAIRRSQGGALHSTLYRLLIDGEHSRDVGALLTSRYGDDLDLRFAGSPLLSRASVIQQPLLAESDAAGIGMPLNELRALLGSTTSMARRLAPSDAGARAYEIVEYLNADKASIVKDLPAKAVEVLANARAFDDADALSQQALLTLGSRGPDGTFVLARVVAETDLTREVQARSPGWPPDWEESVWVFVSMLAGANDAIWIDRYLFADIPRLQAFLIAVRAKTNGRIRLLASDDREVAGLATRVAREIGTIDGVDVRMMTWADRRVLHDRHLVLPDSSTGFILPTAGVILGRDEPGSAVAVRMPALAVDYSQFWRRASQVSA